MALWLYLLSYGSGLASAPFLLHPDRLIWIPPLSAMGFLLWRRSKFATLPLALFFWSLGVVLYQVETTPPAGLDQIHQFAGETPVTVTGTVLKRTPRFPDGQTIDLRTETVAREHQHFAVQGNLRLYIDSGTAPAEPGSRVAFRSRLRLPRTYGTPGEFDLPRHLAYQQIFATAFLPDNRALVVFAPDKIRGYGPIEELRVNLGRNIDQAVPLPWSPLVRALVIGDKGSVSPEQKQLMADSGISHLFAISGLHLGLIAALLYALIHRLYRHSETLLLLAPPMRLLPVLLLPLLLGYLLLTGHAISTCRAFAMGLTATILLFGSRQVPPLKLLASCAFVFLLVEPLLLYQPAFQLSFSALFGILTLLPRWRLAIPRLPPPWGYLAILLLTTLAATVGTAPLVLMNFHLFAPAAPITNLITVPAIGLVAVPMGLIGALLSPYWPAGGNLLLQGCAEIIRLSLTAVEQILLVPGLSAQVIYASPAELLAVILLLTLLLLPATLPRKWLLRGLAAMGALALLLGMPQSPTELKITALSVGQGDATLVSFDNHHVLVDGGGFYGDAFDPGERLVAPALGWLGVRTLEAVVLTHNHPDHRKGLLYILKNFTIGQFWTAVPREQLDPEILSVLQQRQIPLHNPSPGWTQLQCGPAGTLQLFAPDQNTPSLNNRSLVILAGLGRDQALLTGDLEDYGIRQLLDQPQLSTGPLLKWPHHGSRNCLPESLLDHLAPQMAFASLGFGNSHKFPHSEVVTALRQHDIRLWRTDLDGSLQFVSMGWGWQATHWNQRLFR